MDERETASVPEQTSLPTDYQAEQLDLARAEFQAAWRVKAGRRERFLQRCDWVLNRLRDLRDGMFLCGILVVLLSGIASKLSVPKNILDPFDIACGMGIIAFVLLCGVIGLLHSWIEWWESREIKTL
jgi:hypothetical protein